MSELSDVTVTNLFKSAREYSTNCLQYLISYRDTQLQVGENHIWAFVYFDTKHFQILLLKHIFH